MAGTKPFPTTEYTLTLFIKHLAKSDVSLRTMKVYLTAIRHMHVCKGLHNHFNHQIIPRLPLVLRGIKERQAGKHFTLNHAYQSPFQSYTTPRWRCQKKPPHMTIPHSGLCAALPSSAFWGLASLQYPQEVRMTTPATCHSAMLRSITEKIPVYYNLS